MANATLLRPLAAFTAFALIPVAVACNGHVVSIGSTGDALSSVPTSTAASQAGASSSSPASLTCATGWAHPNICCSASANGAATCGEWEDNKFHACDSGDTTYPNLLSCCQLSNGTNCVDATSPANPPTPTAPPPAYGCGYACPPGWWADSASTCCTLSSGSSVPECESWAAQPISTPACGPTLGGPTPATDAGAVSSQPTNPADDAGFEDAGAADDGGCDYDFDSGYAPGYDGGAASLCGACPAGWTPDSVQPEVCCAQIGNATLCFSQATGWANGGNGFDGSDDDAGVNGSGTTSPPSDGTSWATSGAGLPDGATFPNCSGSSSSCLCDHTVNGNEYELKCTTQESNGEFTCDCMVNSLTTGTATVASCADATSITSVFSSASTGCGFP
jgi:hypothetical protein